MSEEFSPKKVRERQIRWGVGALLAVFILAFLWASASDDGKPTNEQAAAKIKTANINAPGAQIDDREAWRSQADAQMRAMEQRIAELTEKSKAAGAQDGAPKLTAIPNDPLKVPAVEPKLGDDEAYQKAEAARLESLNRQNKKDGMKDGIPPPLPPAKAAQAKQNQSGAAQAKSALPPDPPPGLPGQQAIPVAPPVEMPRKIVTETIKPKSPDEQLKAGIGGASGKSDTERKNVGSFLPAGSFVRATLLMGMDAPTGGQSQTNAQPVLLHVVDNATLPNHFRYQAKDCFIIGSGFGDMSSERAYIRTETLSCVLKDGTALEMPLKGHIAGEDGKVGLRGRLVSKQGQILANALLAGIASGIGQAFQQSNTTQSVSPLGSTNTVTPGKSFEAGAGAGVGNAMTRLSQYYISTAEKMFPVIEIDAGRMVEVIVTKGVMLAESAGASGEDIQFDEISKRNRRVSRNEDY